MRIFMTGASGCIGHYLVETLIKNTDHELFLMMRNPAKLQVPTRITTVFPTLVFGSSDKPLRIRK